MLFRLPASTLMSTTRSRSRNVHSTSVTLRLPKTHSSTCNASRLAGVSKMWLTSLVTWRYWYVLLLYFVCYVLLSSPQLDSLRTRVGIEGFFCIVRNNTEFHINPTWYFTCKEIAEYMPVAVGKKWSATSVASKLEAFAIAGCDVISRRPTLMWDFDN